MEKILMSYAHGGFINFKSPQLTFPSTFSLLFMFDLRVVRGASTHLLLFSNGFGLEAVAKLRVAYGVS